MLHRYIDKFFDYCRLADFSNRSVQALTARLNEFDTFLKIQRISSIKRVSYRHLIGFVADYKAPSIHVTKSRVWAMRQFYHFLTLHRVVPKNIATGIPYPKIEKTIPQFLIEGEYTRLIRHFTERADSPMGLRNLIIVMLLGTLGLRTSTLTALNIEDIDLTCGTMWVREKGRQHRSMVLPHSFCKMIRKYLQPQHRKKGPLLMSIRKKRISPRTLQDIFRAAADQVGIDKKLHDLSDVNALPFYDVPKIRSGYRKYPDALTPGQIKRLFESIDDDTILGIRDYAVYALMCQLGLRVGEVYSLDMKNLDLEGGKITVIGKGDKPRTLHINDELMEILCQYLAVREQFYSHWLTPALFVSKKGNRLAIRTMEDNFKNILLYTSIDVPFNVTCHTLRHSMASHLNDNDVDILIIQSILGHASTRSTEPYIHPSADRIRKALEKLPGIQFIKELIRKGELNLSFQKAYKPKRE